MAKRKGGWLGTSLWWLFLLALGAELVARVPWAGAAIRRAYPPGNPTYDSIKSQQVAGGPASISDPEIGNRARPGRHDTVRTPEFTYVAQTDSAGFFNREPWPTRADLVVLGNSLVTGPGVGLDGQFTTLLAQKLGGAAVLNLAFGGVSPPIQELIYRRYGAPRRPTVVLACIWVASDIDNTLQYEHWVAEGRPGDFYEFRAGYGRSHASARRRAADFLKGRSRAVQTVNRVMHGRRWRKKYLERAGFPSGDTILLSHRTQEALAAGMRRPGLPDLRARFFAPLARLRDTVEAHGAHFAVVLIPSKEELYGAERYPAVLRTIGEVKAGLDSAGLRTLDLYQPVRRRSRGASPFFRRDIHLNALGNELVAAAIAEWLVAEDLFDTPRSDTQ